MEFITNYPQNTKIELTGEKLTGDIDFIHSRSLRLLPTDAQLKSIFGVTTAIYTVDTFGGIIEAETELIVNVYNYEKNLNIIQLYALFCYATIFNYMTLTNHIRDRGIMHNDDFYRPTVLVPDFEDVKDEILREIESAYG